MKTAIVEADVLCIGGGIAGLMAAIRASELGAKVVIAEKANTLRSGAGGVGIDHFGVYMPEVHGPDIESLARRMASSNLYAYMMRPDNFFRTRLKKSAEILKLWESWGIPMRYKGEYHFNPPNDLKYEGRDQKIVLTKEARKRGVEIVNRVMVFDLLRDESGVAGAVGVHTRENKLIEFRAKTVILGTGKCIRLYQGPTPGWMFNIETSPATTGDGRAMAYRAGVELANMEKLVRWAGMKYFTRCGKGTWIGVIRDTEGKPIGPFRSKPDILGHGDPVSDSNPAIFENYISSGKGPCFMCCEGASDDDVAYMRHWLVAEGNTTALNYLDEEGIDVKKNGVEFMTYELETWGGIPYNEKGETSVEGLYAAGDEYGDQGSQAAIFGFIAGENAASYARKKTSETNSTKMKKEIKAKNEFLSKIRSRKIGATWQEVNIAIQQIMQDYAGSVRSEPVLKVGLNNLRRLRDKTRDAIMAKNPHELMRCLEVLNLLDLGELVFVAALERKETRDTHHVRADYPLTNPSMDNVLIIKMKDGKPITEWRKRGK